MLLGTKKGSPPRKMIFGGTPKNRHVGAPKELPRTGKTRPPEAILLKIGFFCKKVGPKTVVKRLSAPTSAFYRKLAILLGKPCRGFSKKRVFRFYRFFVIFQDFQGGVKNPQTPYRAYLGSKIPYRAYLGYPPKRGSKKGVKIDKNGQKMMFYTIKLGKSTQSIHTTL